MKKQYTPFITGLFLTSFILLSFNFLSAQCNVNDKYDKIVSGYHSSIALKATGTFGCWGQAIKSDGTSDALTPEDINSTNYTALGSATPLKAAIGGAGGGGKDQYILLTTDGLYAWGAKGNVLSTSLLNVTAFTKIGTPTGGDATTKLPTGVNPSDVAMLFATYQTLALLTNGGNVYIITQTSANLQGDGSSTVSATTWHKVKTDATHDLTNVTAIRGQVSNGTYNAFMALTSSGQVYVWGSSVYLNDGNTSASKNYATQLSLPAEFSTYTAKLIGVTGGIKNSSSVKNTFFVLSSSGHLFALGDNSRRQCGDFATTERKTWVTVKSDASTNFSNISFFSCQEHNASSSPGVAAITAGGDLYTWGENEGLMLGRTTAGTLYDPGIPLGFTQGTDKALTTELGGHTLVYLKVGSSQFCYVGHKTNGSMGDNTSASTNLNTFDCTNTPQNFVVCGSATVVASTVTSTISASQTTIMADGSSTTIITIQLKDLNGNNLTSSGGTIVVITSAGTLGDVIDNNNGTYTVTLTSGNAVTTATINYTINGSLADKTASVSFEAPTTLPLNWMQVLAYRQNKTVKIIWSTNNEVNVKAFDIDRSLDAINWTTIISNIPAANTTGTKYYQQIDTAYNSKALLYRIRQADFDRHYSYSSVLMVAAVTGNTNITLFPVPAKNTFHLGNITPGQINKIQLININGEVLRTWQLLQSAYDIQDIPTGIYTLRIETTDGIIQKLQFSKQ
jgi:alpha-tubulin suppressor-like RCC1 family protein